MNSIESGVYYILVSADKQTLERECKLQQKHIKLIDSYDLELYDEFQKYKYEPFRSR